MAELVAMSRVVTDEPAAVRGVAQALDCDAVVFGAHGRAHAAWVSASAGEQPRGRPGRSRTPGSEGT